MKTTEQWFLEFYNEVRHQLELGSKGNFVRANQIWGEYRAAEQSVQSNGVRFCPACHALLEDHSVYCDNCGTDTPRG